MSSEQHVENLMKSTMENLKDMIDVNTVIGKAIETKDGTCIIPVSKLSFGFASGGSEYLYENTTSTVFPFGGGSGAGVSVKPVAFLVVKQDGVRMIPADQNTTCDRIVDTVPQILDIIKGFVKDLCKKNNEASDKNNTSNAVNNFEKNSTNNDNVI